MSENSYEKETARHTQQQEEQQENSPQSEVGIELPPLPEVVQSRGLNNPAMQLSFAENFPQIYALIQNEAEVLKKLEVYAQKIGSGNYLGQSDQYLALIDERQQQIIPVLLPYLENLDPEELDAKYDQFRGELSRLGMQMTFAEGMLTSIGPGSLMQISNKNFRIEANTHPILLYDKFLDVCTQSMNGEYPYSNYTPYLEIVALGEKINQQGGGELLNARILTDYQHALAAVTDVHLVGETGGRVGGIHTEYYPYMCDLELLKTELEKFPDLKVGSVISRILEHPSKISERPADIYLIVKEWVDSEEDAKKRVFELLNEGEDIPHYLAVYQGNGIAKYAITYRFFESQDEANAAFSQQEKLGNAYQLVFASVKGEKLYQIGI